MQLSATVICIWPLVAHNQYWPCWLVDMWCSGLFQEVKRYTIVVYLATNKIIGMPLL